MKKIIEEIKEILNDDEKLQSLVIVIACFVLLVIAVIVSVLI